MYKIYQIEFIETEEYELGAMPENLVVKANSITEAKSKFFKYMKKFNKGVKIKIRHISQLKPSMVKEVDIY